MIDEYWTWRCYGYHSDELKPSSHKPIVAVCDDCGVYRVVRKCSYSEMCRSCSRKGERSEFYGKHHTDDAKSKMSAAHMGAKNHMYGKHHTDETKLKMSLSTIGQECTDETKPKMSISHTGAKNYMYGKRGEESPNYGRHHTKESILKMSIAHAGENHENWKGGITPWRTSMWRSQAYQNWRTAVFERDDYTCQMCGDDSGGNLQAHHIEPVRDNKNTLLIFDVNNGITLCEDCHQKTYGKEYDFVEQFESIIRGDIK